MKKTIGFLAALTLTLTSMGVTASGAEFFYYDGTEVSAAQAAEDAVYAAIESGSQAAERKAVEKYAKETCDPGYYKAKKAQQEAERNAGGGDEPSAEEMERRATLTKQTLNSTKTYVKYIDDYIVHNTAFDGANRTLGIDVSQFQYTIDWNAVKADGIKFAIIRLGYRGYGSEGTLCTDPYFESNIRNAKAAGIKVGVYFFTQAISTAEARAEARYVMDVLNGAYLDMPIYYDIEAYPASYGARMDYAGLSKAAKTNNCRAFCDEIEKGGYTAGVYSYRNYFYSDVDGPALGNEYPVWLAEYTDEASYSGAYHMWQFASTASVDGIATNCDISVCYGDENLGGKGTVTKVDVPTGLSASGNTLKWNKVDGANGYEVYKHDTDKGTYTSVGTTTGTSLDIKSASSDYPYCVRAYVTDNGNKVYSAYSDDIFVGDKTITGFRADLLNGNVSLSWSKDPDATGYTIYRSKNDTEFVKIGETSSLSYTDSGLDSNAQKYNYYVQSNTGKKSNVVTIYFSVDKSKAPVFSSCTADSVTVTWNEMKGVSGYQLLERNPSTGAYAVKGDVKAGADRKYTFTSLEAGTTNRFAVRAYILNGTEKTFGEISDDLTAKTVPPAVTGLSYTSTDTGIKLKWNKAQGAEKYAIYRKTDSTYKKLGTVTGTAVNITTSGTAAKQYCVAAVITQGGSDFQGAYSNVISAKSNGIGTPTITSGVYADNSITLTWSKAANASGYRLYKYDASSKTYKSIKTLSGADKTSYTVTGVQSGITELFKVKAFKREDSGVKWGSASAAFSVKTLDPLPAPANVTVNATPSSIKITWDKVEGADLYNVYEVNGSNYDMLGEATGTSFTVSSGAGNGRSFVVSAVSKSGSTKTAGKYSAVAKAPKVPGTPTLSASNNKSDSVKISWTVPDGASGVRLYMYNTSKKTYVTVKTMSNKKNACTIKGLSANTAYKFKAKAYTKTSGGITWGKASSVFTAYTSS